MAALRISKEELKELMEKGKKFILLDVRSPDSYNVSSVKIKGSLRKNPMAVESWSNDVPAGDLIVTYCT